MTAKYTITVYLADGEKDHSDLMTREQVENWVRKSGKGKTYMIWDMEEQREVTSKF